MSYLTVLKSNCMKIEEKHFMEWLESKDIEWWHKYGLSPSGEYEDQDDESDVKGFVPEFLMDFNSKGIIITDGIGADLALLQMIEEYLKEKHYAEDDIFEGVFEGNHILIVRK